MGRNRWRDADDWPPPGMEVRAFHLHSRGGANTLNGDGLLAVEVPSAAEPPDTYVYDPLDPVPSMGGPTLSQPGGLPGWNAAPYDQRAVEARPDVLCYTTPPLREPIEVIGSLELVLYASSSARDTDFTGKLVDVGPDGRAESRCDGILRARRRHGVEREDPLTPGTIEEFRIQLGPTANAFLPGHRIRLEVSSSNFPRFDPNPNTGHPTPFETADRLRPATNRVFHDARHPSHLRLPVAPPEP
jgi:putative CocE/NonD family hydrolase